MWVLRRFARKAARRKIPARRRKLVQETPTRMPRARGSAVGGGFPASLSASSSRIQSCCNYRQLPSCARLGRATAPVPTRSLAACSLATDLAGGCHGAQDGAHDIGGESGGVGLQLRHGLLLIFFHGGAGLLDLFLGTGAGLTDSLGAGLGGLLAASFLVLEDFLAGFAEALLVVGGRASTEAMSARAFSM